MKKQTYKCGTLTYTRCGVVTLFCWLLWGDFCLVLLENTRPVIVPLLLRAHDASNFTIGLLCGSIPPLLNFIVNPIISTASDRTRTRRWGRRIPYLLWGVPFVSMFLILLGFSDQIGRGLAGLVTENEAAVASFVIGVLACFSIGFLFFDLFAGCVYYYLFSDVVPQELLGRFMGFFRMAGSCGGLLFNLLVMPGIQTHMALVCIVIALIYVIGFGGMCLKVKEGEYPPPSPGGMTFVDRIRLYFKECFSMPYWLIVFLGLGLNNVSTVCRALFNILYGTEYLGLSTGEYGRIMACGSILSIGLAIPVGYLIDRFHPLRMYIAAAWMVIAVNIYGFFFCHDYPSFFITTMLITVVYVIQNNSGLPLSICLFPKSQFGQFSSANAMIKSVLLVASNAFGGWFIDQLGYQYLFVWDFLFTFLSVLLMHWVYLRWKQLGGEHGYVPPTIAQREEQKNR
ncbi:MFS transporter [uncultured Victivallis sp.]|uniref:MFS transporter n=1 Tax=uncultured Victivallis sp. TaxID=354118 RepID=UPI0025F233A6|nr:MFS transporter [uncultured Victivallis sp.]